MNKNPKYPIYIISKGRWESRLTSKVLELMKVHYKIVIEPQEYDQYSKVINPKKILVLPFHDLNQGSIPARNWVWEYSIKKGYKRHWILDDNIRWFARLHNNKKTIVSSGICFKIIEDFISQYKNIALAGMQYEMFTPTMYKIYPFILNTRIYSCILIKNDIPYRWRGKYNEDTDLSIRVLKDGWCTILMQNFICKKMKTMTMKGGNTDSLYKLKKIDGRLLMAQSLQKQHPGIVTIKFRFNRWQHVVNYNKFRKNRLIKNKNFKIKKYKLKLINK